MNATNSLASAELDLSTVHPTGSLVLVHMRPGLQQTASGLIIPPSAQQITQNGDVLAIGPDVRHVAVGDLVLVNLHSGTHVAWKQNTPVLLVKLDDIQAVLQADD